MGRLPLAIEDAAYADKLTVFATDLAPDMADALSDESIETGKAQAIVETMMFNFAMMIDQRGRYRIAGKDRPRLAFDNGLGQCALPTGLTHLHETVHAVVESVFSQARYRD